MSMVNTLPCIAWRETKIRNKTKSKNTIISSREADDWVENKKTIIAEWHVS